HHLAVLGRRADRGRRRLPVCAGRRGGGRGGDGAVPALSRWEAAHRHPHRGDQDARLGAPGRPVPDDRLHRGGVLAGIGGSLLITAQQYVSPADVGFEIAALALLAVVIGGSTSVVGTLLGV